MKAPRTVLVVVTRRIGDVLLATPLVRSIKSALPGAQIDALVFAGTEGALEANPDLRAVLTVSERPAVGEHLALARRLWRRYDAALSVVPGDRPTLYAWLAGRWSAGLVIDGAKHAWKRRLLDAHAAFDNLDTHTVRMNLALAPLLGVAARAEVVVAWSDGDARAVDARLAAASVRPPARSTAAGSAAAMRATYSRSAGSGPPVSTTRRPRAAIQRAHSTQPVSCHIL